MALAEICMGKNSDLDTALKLQEHTMACIRQISELYTEPILSNG